MGTRWPNVPADFVYPVCQVCGEQTPKFSKAGTRVTHAKRLRAKTCGGAKCFGVLVGRRKTRGPLTKSSGSHVVMSDLDVGFQLFNFDREIPKR